MYQPNTALISAWRLERLAVIVAGLEVERKLLADRASGPQRALPATSADPVTLRGDVALRRCSRQISLAGVELDHARAYDLTGPQPRRHTKQYAVRQPTGWL